MQRVALARALILKPPIILADEPTGNLDTSNASRIMDLLEEMSDDGLTVVYVTHNLQLAKRSRLTLEMCDGALTGFDEE